MPHSLRPMFCASLIMMGMLPVAELAAAVQPRLADAYGKLPLRFEVNAGQVDEAVRFLCRGQGYTMFLTPAEAVLSLGDTPTTTVVGLRMAGANEHPRMIGESPIATSSNYFIGSDPRRWHVGVANYARVRYEGVYPGVDLVYLGNQRQLEYNFVIAPGRDPRRIRLAFRGADSIILGAQGELILHTANGELVQSAPTVYQEAAGRRQRIEASYILLPALRGAPAGEGGRHVGFSVSRYDRSRPLIIDPVLVYSTFLGGSGDDFGSSIAVDTAGNSYITGWTNSVSFPGVGSSSIQPSNVGVSAAFVTKLNAAGTAIIYSTFLGGSGNTEDSRIAVDSAGNAYVAGSTDSTSFPGVTASSIQPTNAGSFDAFVTKINSTGSAIVYSTFLGGSGNEQCTGLAVDNAGNAYVVGITSSIIFPGVTGSSIQSVNASAYGAGFVTKINAAGTAIVYSTFLGNDGGPDAIAVDSAGDAYIAGSTTQPTFPGVTGSSIQPAYGGGPSDAVVAKINAAGTAIVYSTLLGGSGIDFATGIAVDSAGNAYVTGATSSTTFPGVTGSSIQPTNAGAIGTTDAFLAKINAAGTAIIYSTFLGGSGDDGAYGIAVDGAGNAFVTGLTTSTTFPGVTGSSLQPAYGGGPEDAFVTAINAAGTMIVYSTFLGGAETDRGTGIAVDSAGDCYIVGETTSATFPGVTGGALQPVNGGSYDAFVTKISLGAVAVPLRFYTLAPCRVVDTRQAPSSLGGPALQPSAERVFTLAGTCGIPDSARAASVNLTVAGASAAGFLTLWAADGTRPPTSAINYRTGDVRANNAIVELSADGEAAILVFTGSTGSVEFILDVNGYFQ